MFFDGYCGLCDRFVSFVLACDTRRALRFAPLQGETAAQLLDALMITDERLRTVVYQDSKGFHYRSTAALRIVSSLGGIWRGVAVLWLVPRPVRDAVYNFVARHRFRWFGRRESCRMPTAEERDQFLP